MRRTLRALLCLVGFVATAASAQPVTYTFSGVIDGDIGGTAFAGAAFTWVLQGDASQRSAGGFPVSVPLTAGTIKIAGTACATGCTMTTPAAYVLYTLGPAIANVHGISTVGNIDAAGQTLIEACYAAFCGNTPVNDNLIAPVSPTASGQANGLAPYLGFPTSGGVVTIAFIANGNLTYATPGFSVPTLSEWALLVMAALLAVAGFWHLGRKAPFGA